MSPVTEPDPDPRCPVDLTQRMIMIVEARLVDTVLVVMVIVIDLHLVEATMTMIVVDTVLLPELVVLLMIIHPRVAGSRILTALVILTLILTSMAGLLMIDLHQEITLQEIILQRIMTVLAVTGNSPTLLTLSSSLHCIDRTLKAAIRSGVMKTDALLHKGPKHARLHNRSGCDVDNEFPLVTYPDLFLQKQNVLLSCTRAEGNGACKTGWNDHISINSSVCTP
jgi:hypothetical protein